MGLQQLKALSKFLHYMLGRNPGEFGLLPDAQGYVSIKDLLKALHEEDGWRHVQMGMLKELVISLPEASVEISDTQIRAKERRRLEQAGDSLKPPKLLYTCVRQKAHFHVVENGHYPPEGTQVILCTDSEMAERLGKRKDAKPVLLTVLTDALSENGVDLTPAGNGLFSAPYLPDGTFTAPPLPKERPETKSPEKKKKMAPESTPLSGGYFPDPDRMPIPPGTPHKKGKPKGGWKQDRKRLRREKEHYWSS